MSVTWLIHKCDMIHSPVWHDSFISVTWLIYKCDMTHSRVWHDSVTSVTCHRRRRSELRLPKIPTSFHGSPRTYQSRFLGSRQSFKIGFTWENGVPSLNRVAGKTGQSRDLNILSLISSVSGLIGLIYAWHDLLVCETWHIGIIYVSRDAFICVTWYIDMIYVSHGSLVFVTWHIDFIYT